MIETINTEDRVTDSQNIQETKLTNYLNKRAQLGGQMQGTTY